MAEIALLEKKAYPARPSTNKQDGPFAGSGRLKFSCARSALREIPIKANKDLRRSQYDVEANAIGGRGATSSRTLTSHGTSEGRRSARTPHYDRKRLHYSYLAKIAPRLDLLPSTGYR